MDAVAIIPARGGSQRIPRKNIQKFWGRPIIEYSIETARNSGLFSQIIVSTDDMEIAELAHKLGAKVFTRESDDGKRGTQEVAAEALRAMDAPPKYACCIYATAPLMSAADLINASQMLNMHAGAAAYVYSVCGWLDAAQFYFGHTDAFKDGIPLEHWSTRRFQIDPSRFCDVNTWTDFSRAEAMYAALNK